MKSLIASICILGLVGMIVGVAVKAGTESSVTATVTAQNISVSVLDGTVTYGTMAVSTWKSTLDLSDGQTATNNGNVTENFNIKGQNSANWTLAASPASEQYTHQRCNDTALDCSTPPTNYTAMTVDYAPLATGVAKDGTVLFQLRLGTPTATANFAEQSVNVTVQATI